MEILEGVLEEKEKRKKLFLDKGVVKLSEWKGADAPPRIVLMIDEYAELLLHIRGFQRLLSSVARTGRKFGIHLIVATQRPDAKTINPQIRGTFLNTMAFRVANKSNARVLEAPGAELIPLKAKGLGYFVGRGQTVLLQTPLAEALPKRGGGEDSLESVEEAALGDEPVHEPVSEKSNGGGWSPARKTDPGAVFFSRKKLAHLLGCDPAEKGFCEVRKRKKGRLFRGYWAKNSKPSEPN